MDTEQIDTHKHRVALYSGTQRYNGPNITFAEKLAVQRPAATTSAAKLGVPRPVIGSHPFAAVKPELQIPGLVPVRKSHVVNTVEIILLRSKFTYLSQYH